MLLLSCGIISAQTNFLPADSAIVWTGVTTGFYGGPDNVSYYWTQFSVDSIDNDTIINSLEYNKLNNTHEYFTAYRSDTLNQTIYFVPKDSVNEYLFFDYSLTYQVGDSVFIPHYLSFNELSGAYFKLLEIDSNLIDNSYYKTYNFEALYISDSLTNIFSPSAYYSSPEIKIAERMITGSSFPFFGVGHFETFFDLYCYQENGVFHWSNGGTCPLLDFTSVNENEQSKFTTYPNPSGGQFIIEMEQFETTLVTIYGLSGKKVHSSQTDFKSTSLNLSHLPKGIYILELETPTQLVQEKIIIQ